MSIKENIISVALRLSGGAAFDTLSKSAETLRAKLGDLPGALARGEITADQFAKQAVKLSGELGRQQKILDAYAAAEAVAAAAVTTTTTAMAGQAGAASAWGGVMKSASDGVKDAAVARAAAEAEAAAASRAAAAAMQAEAAAAKGAASGAYDLAEAAEHAGRAEYDLANSVKIASAAATSSKPGLSAVDAAMEEIAGSGERAAAKLAKVGTAAGNVRAGSGQLLQGINNLGYAFQDFTSTTGDLGQKLNSVSNNLPQIISLLGVGGPLAAGLAATGVAAIALYRNWDSVSGLWEDRRPIDGATEGVDALTRAVKSNETALDALREKGDLNLAQMAEFRRLTDEQATAEAALAAARETEANKKAHTELSGERDKQLAGAVGKAVDTSGGYEAVVRQFVDAYLASIHETGNEEIRAENTKLFEDLLNKALKGDKKAIASLRGDSDRDKSGQVGTFSGLVDAFDPQTEQVRKAKEQEREKRDKVAETLNAQGQENKGLGDEKAGKTADRAARNAAAGTDRFIAEANANETHNDAVDARAARDRRKTGRRTTAETAADVAKNTTLDEEGAAVLARSRAEAAALRARGQDAPSDRKQQAMLAQQYANRLKAGGMNPFRAASVGSTMAAKSAKDVDAQALAEGVRQQGQAGHAGLENQSKLIAVAADLSAQAQQAMAVQQQHGRAIEGVSRQLRQTRRSQQNQGR